MIFDSHAHYDDKQFQRDREALLSSMDENNIRYIVNVGANISGSKKTISLARQYDFIYAAIGVHPSDISCLDDEGLDWMEKHASAPKVVAIGEIGLDYHWGKGFDVQQRQQIWFKRQLQLAREAGLPVIIHSREAAADTMELMRQHAQGIPGIIHCYSYSKEMAQEFVEMGYYIGVGGVITYKNAKKLKETVETIPIEWIVIETDCPYLSPEPKRGKRNSSLYLPYIVEEIARIKNMRPQDVEDITCANARKVYRI